MRGGGCSSLRGSKRAFGTKPDDRDDDDDKTRPRSAPPSPHLFCAQRPGPATRTHQQYGRSQSLFPGLLDKLETVFVGHVVLKGGLRDSKVMQRWVDGMKYQAEMPSNAVRPVT